MRILFSDILADCVVSAANTDTNFPVSNLGHPFLRRRWQSTQTSDTITIESAIATDINSIYIDYTNATDIEITFYGFDIVGYGADTIGFSAGEEVGLESPDAGTPIPITNNVWHGSTTFSKIEIAVSADSPDVVYVGKVALGMDYALPSPSSFWPETYEDKSIISISDAGQVLQEFVEPLRVWEFEFPTLNRDDTRALQAEYRATGIGKPIFVDPDTDDLPVMYCRLKDPMTTSKSLRRYVTTLSFVEAR